uniref:Putative effector protein n=1 Tax=Heterodera avenae TaxID=34510 RepID=A0A2L0VDH3_HETAV|nr:putative effector protein [Heterodera avenae]
MRKINRPRLGILLALFYLSFNFRMSSQDAGQQPTVTLHNKVGVTELNMQNLEIVLRSAQVVFVAFCADWCPFSRKLRPVFEEAAIKWHDNNPNSSVVWALVDSVQQADVAEKYFVNKYPTMKIFINGELIKNEYRSTRSVEALTEFVKKQLEVSINEFPSVDYLNGAINADKRNVIAYFHCQDCVDYQNFQKIAALLRDDCSFWVGRDAALTAIKENMLLFRDPTTHDEQKFTGSFADYEFMKNWLTDKCIPLVREVTFENVEEMTEEGLPFLILFRDPKNKEIDKKFIESVARELFDQKTAVNALLADGLKFAHPLKHMGKTSRDLPVLAIDSFQHMFLFENMNELHVPGKLRKFVMDMHSGELHKKFHETLDEKIAELQKKALEQLDAEFGEVVGGDAGEARAPAAMPKVDTTPVPSIFKELKPSEKRYSIIQKTEL